MQIDTIGGGFGCQTLRAVLGYIPGVFAKSAEVIAGVGVARSTEIRSAKDIVSRGVADSRRCGNVGDYGGEASHIAE